jgi:hypothetical protein
LARRGLQLILKYREVLLGLVFIGYLWGLHPLIMARLVVVTPQTPDRWLGLLVFALPFFDFTGHYLKRPVMVYQARQNREQLGGKIPLLARLLPWAHILLMGAIYFSFLMVFNIYALLEGTFLESVGFFVTLIFPGMVWMLLEGEILRYFTYPFGEDEREWEKYSRIVDDSPPRSPARLFGLWLLAIRPHYPRELSQVDYWKDALGDLLLMVFAMLSYTVIFDFFGLHAPFRLSGGPAVALFDLARFILFFIILYPPLRSAHFYMEQILPRSEAQKALSDISFAAVLIFALFSVPRI